MIQTTILYKILIVFVSFNTPVPQQNVSFALKHWIHSLANQTCKLRAGFVFEKWAHFPKVALGKNGDPLYPFPATYDLANDITQTQPPKTLATFAHADTPFNPNIVLMEGLTTLIVISCLLATKTDNIIPEGNRRAVIHFSKPETDKPKYTNIFSANKTHNEQSTNPIP